uniref:Uncharacterized protein n=1 Tax=Caenorhabditis japonica TaxID=281687 RepID=A0A8R1I628_CAEJA
MKNRLLFPLLTICSTVLPAPISNADALKLVEHEFATIRRVIANNENSAKTNLIGSMPQMNGKWDEIYGEGNYIIKSALYSEPDKQIHGSVDFLNPDKSLRQSTLISMRREEKSKSGWMMYIEVPPVPCAPPPPTTTKPGTNYQ